MPHKWKLLHSEWILKEKWYKVRKDTVEVKPGLILDDYFLGVFGNIVLIVALTSNNNVVLVRQYKHGAGKILLEIPAGYLNEQEDPLVAAQRELLEETGYSSTTWESLGFFQQNPTKAVGNGIHIFLANNVEKTADQHLDATENIEVVTMPFAQALQAIHQGEIQVAGSALALLLAEQK